MLTKKQLSAITINAIVVKMLITFPHSVIEICKNAAWISAAYCAIIAFLLFTAICRVYFSDRNVIGIAERLGGAPMRIVVGIMVFAALFANFFTFVRIFPEVIRLVLLQTTYVELIGLLFAVGVLLGAYCGIEAVARISELTLAGNGIVFLVFIVMLIPTMKIENALPILGGGAYALFIQNIPFVSVFSDLLLLNLLMPHMQNSFDYRRAGMRAVILGGFCAVLIVAAYCFSYVYPVTENYLMPVYQLERLIHLGNFFSRLEAVFQLVWSVSILLYASLYLAVMADVWKETFGLRESKPLLPAIMAAVVGAAFIPSDLLMAVAAETVVNRWLFIPAFALPLFLGTADKMFHVKQSKER